LAELGASRSGARPVLIGFALETATDADVVTRAREKLHKKKVDLVVANHASESIGKDDIRLMLVGPNSADTVGPVPKADAAERLLDWLTARFAELGS
jgi:phosphopantothenoylcysteine decarboxylase/phosphopantothenate--cysteine ligase